MEINGSNHSPHTRRYSIALLITALAIVAAGIALKPKEKRETPVSELESARLQRLTQERRLTELGDYISYASRNAARGLVYIPQLQQSAVAIGPRTLATALHRGVPAAVNAVSSRIPQLQLQFQSRRPDVPVLLLQAPANTPLQVPATAAVDTGDWVLAVALREDGDPVFAYGLYESSADSRCGSFTYKRLRASIPLTGALAGGGLFSLRGDLAGIVARCDTELVVLSIASVTAALKQPVAPNDVLQERFGMRVVEAPDGAGVDVLSVWKGTPAEQARINPGDRIRAIDSEYVKTAEEALAQLDSEGTHVLSLRRGRRDVNVRIASKPPPGQAAAEAIGLVFLDTEAGVTVRSVAKDSPAAHAGVLSGDIVVRAGTATTTSAASVAGEFARSRGPVLLALERNGAGFKVQLTP
jgi:S1-C subfamily serine protease